MDSPTNARDILLEAMSLMGLLPNTKSVSLDATEQSEKLSDLSFDNFMKQGLTVKLLTQIIGEYGTKIVQQFDKCSLTDLTSVQFLHRYDTASAQSLTQQLNTAGRDVYSDENFSLTNFSSKLMHDMNTLSKKLLFQERSKTMKEYMVDIGMYLQENIYLCRDLGKQNDKHNLPGLYYRLLMVHLNNLNKAQRKRKRQNTGGTKLWQPSSDHVFYEQNLYNNMTLLILYAIMHVEHNLQDLTLVLYSQYILRVIQPGGITVAEHNAAHVAVMCQDIPGIIAMLSQSENWNATDQEGLLPIDHALLGMCHANNETSILVFIISCIKSDLKDKVGSTENLAYYTSIRLNFIYDIFKLVLELNYDKLLDLTSGLFPDLYGEVWSETDVMSQIPQVLNFCWSERKQFFNTLNHISSVIDYTSKSDLLKMIVENCLTEHQQQKVSLLRDDFLPLASVPMVLDEIKAKVVYNSYFGCPRKLVLKNLSTPTTLHDEDSTEPLTLDQQEYSALFLNWSPLIQNVATKYNYSLKSAKTLNDPESIYVYCFLLGLFQFSKDIQAAVNIMKDKVRTIGGNGKPFRFLKRKRADCALTTDYVVGCQNM